MPQHNRGGQDSDSEESDAESPPPRPIPIPRSRDSMSKDKQTGKAIGKVGDSGVDEDGFLNGIDLRAQMAAWDRLRNRDTGKRGRAGGRGRDGGRGRSRGGPIQSGRDEGLTGSTANVNDDARDAPGGGIPDGAGDGSQLEAQEAAAVNETTTTKWKTAKQRTAFARLARQRNLQAAKSLRRGDEAGRASAEDGDGTGMGTVTFRYVNPHSL